MVLDLLLILLHTGAVSVFLLFPATFGLLLVFLSLAAAGTG